MAGARGLSLSPSTSRPTALGAAESAARLNPVRTPFSERRVWKILRAALLRGRKPLLPASPKKRRPPRLPLPRLSLPVPDPALRRAWRGAVSKHLPWVSCITHRRNTFQPLLFLFFSSFFFFEASDASRCRQLLSSPTPSLSFSLSPHITHSLFHPLLSLPSLPLSLSLSLSLSSSPSQFFGSSPAVPPPNARIPERYVSSAVVSCSHQTAGRSGDGRQKSRSKNEQAGPACQSGFFRPPQTPGTGS